MSGGVHLVENDGLNVTCRASGKTQVGILARHLVKSENSDLCGTTFESRSSEMDAV